LRSPWLDSAGTRELTVSKLNDVLKDTNEKQSMKQHATAAWTGVLEDSVVPAAAAAAAVVVIVVVVVVVVVLPSPRRYSSE
jgi:hypothetical protein